MITTASILFGFNGNVSRLLFDDTTVALVEEEEEASSP